MGIKILVRLLKSTIDNQDLSGIKQRFIYTKQGGIFSPKRKYLRVTRDKHILDICASPFSNGIFVSYWLGISSIELHDFVSEKINELHEQNNWNFLFNKDQSSPWEFNSFKFQEMTSFVVVILALLFILLASDI